MSYEQFVNPLLWEPSVEECHRTGQVESHSPKAQRYRQGLEVALIPLLEKRQRRIQSRKCVYGVAVSELPSSHGGVAAQRCKLEQNQSHRQGHCWLSSQSA